MKRRREKNECVLDNAGEGMRGGGVRLDTIMSMGTGRDKVSIR